MGASPNKQKNYCSNLLLKAKKDHFSQIFSVTDNKSFRQTVKHLSSNKEKSHIILNLVEKYELIDDKKTAKIFNKYFVNIVQKLGIVI